jgi:hypothetical protein
MEGSVLSFLKAEWKVSDTGSAHWSSSSIGHCVVWSSIYGFRLLLWYLLSRYICYWNLNFIDNVFITKTKVRLPQA